MTIREEQVVVSYLVDAAPLLGIDASMKKLRGDTDSAVKAMDGGMKDMMRALRGADSTVDELGQSVKRMGGEARGAVGGMEALADGVERVGDEAGGIEELRAHVKDLEAQLGAGAAEMEEMRGQVDRLEGELAGTKDELAKASDELEKLGQSADRSGGKVKSFGDNFKSMLAALGVNQLISRGADFLGSAVTGALGRLDTMDQFTRTMGIMTGSTDNAQRAMDSLKESVTGTGYNLSTAALAAQNFTTSGMRMGVATDTVDSWANAVSRYADGSDDALQRVTYSLSKMQTRGKVMMDDMNEILIAGIPAISIYAEQVGKTTLEVTDMMGKGKLSTDDFIQGMNQAFEQGTATFASVAGAAQEAGSSWESTMSNFAIYAVRGMGEVVTATDAAVEAVSGSGIREHIADFGRGIEDALGNVAEHIGPVVAGLDNMKAGFVAVGAAVGVIKLKAAFDKVAAGAKLATLAIKTYKSGVVVATAADKDAIASLSVKQIVQATDMKATMGSTSATIADVAAKNASTVSINANTAAMALATKAKMALNAVMGNPFAIAVAGIAAVAAVVYTLNENFNEGYKKAKALREELGELNEAGRELRDSVSGSQAAFEQEIGAIDSRVESSNALLESLRAITDENGRVVDGSADVMSMIAQMNAYNPELGLSYNANTGAISMTTDAIAQQVAQMSEVEKSHAFEDRTQELIGEQNSLQASIAATTEKMDELRSAGASTESIENYAKEYYGENYTDEQYAEAEDIMLGKEFAEARAEVQGYEADLAGVEDQIEENAAAASDYTQSLKEHSVEVEALAESYGILPEKMQEAFGASSMGLEDWLAAQESVLATAQEIYDRNMAGIINSFNALPTEYDKSAAQLLENIQGNVATKAQSVEFLAEFDTYGLNDAFIADIEAQGSGAVVSIGTELEAMDEAELKAWVDNVNAAYADASEQATTETLGGEELAAAAKAAGFESADEFVIAFNTRLGESSLGEAAFENFETPEVDADTFTGGMSDIADSTADTSGSLAEDTGLTNEALDGFSAKMSETREAVSGEMETIKGNAQTLASEIQLAFEGLATTLYTAGVNAMAGLRDGMESMREAIQETAASLASEVPTTVKAAQEQQSPSKVMRRIGEFSGLGFALGIEDTLPEVKGAATDMAGAALPPPVHTPESGAVTNNNSRSVVNNYYNQYQMGTAFYGVGSPQERQNAKVIEQIVKKVLDRLLKQADEGDLVEA